MSTFTGRPILVTGAAGNVGAIGRTVVELLRERGLSVRALVRQEDERASALRETGAEVVVGDSMRAADVVRAMKGCRRVYFGMSVTAAYLEAAVTAAAVARQQGDLEVFVNISQMTVSEMDLAHMTDSSQQRQHWLAEQVLAWSGLPVVEIRATVFLEHPFFLNWAAESIAADDTLCLPFGNARTSPIAAGDVAAVVATILSDPAPLVNKVYELTGPRSATMEELAAEYSSALGRTITYVDMPFEEWRYNVLSRHNLPKHLFEHFLTMARLHAEKRYDRLTHDVEAITGRAPSGVRELVARHPELFGPMPFSDSGTATGSGSGSVLARSA